MTVIGDDIVESVMDDLQLIVEAYGGPHTSIYEPERSFAQRDMEKARDLLAWLHQEHREHVKDMVVYAQAQLTLGEATKARAAHVLFGLTADSLATFKLYAEDAENWSGSPWVSEGNVGVTKAMRGNLSDLVQKGFITIEDFGSIGESAHAMFIEFTPKGAKLATDLGIDLGGSHAQEKMRESLPADPLADLDVQIVIGQIEQLR